MEQVGHLTKLYETGEHLFRKDPVRVRCRYVFVAALDAEKKGSALDYNLFRTYACPPNNTKLCKGPNDPSTYLMAHAFAVTDAAKYFSTPWMEQLDNNGETKFLDTKFLNPRNITELALDEIWGLFGTDVPISIVVNIGPGLPNSSDFETISRRFSWGLDSLPPNYTSLERVKRMIILLSQMLSINTEQLDYTKLLWVIQNISSRVSVKSSGRSKDQHPSQWPDAGNKTLVETTDDRGIHFDTGKVSLDKAPSKHRVRDLFFGQEKIPKTTTFGSIEGRVLDEYLQRLESDIKKDIQKNLKAIYPDNTPPYYRLAPNNSPKGTVHNDTSAPRTVLDATNEFLADPHSESTMENARSLLVA